MLPVGYADGYDRELGNRAYVLVKGKRAPVIGRICMNHTMIDVTDIPGVELEMRWCFSEIRSTMQLQQKLWPAGEAQLTMKL